MQEAQSTIASLRSVTKNYGAIAALKEVNLDVRAGELLAVLGPNGAGKTTSIRLMLGLMQPGSGEVRVFGRDPRRHENRTGVGAMLQVAKVPETLRVREHISLFRSYYPDPLPFAEIVGSAGLDGMEHRLFGSLSGGEKQRVLFALAICGNPRLIFLDEPTVGLDVSTRHLIWQQIRKLTGQGRTVVLTTHYLEEVDALADRVVVLNQGTVVAEGSAAEIKSKTSLRKIRCATRLTPVEIGTIAGVSEVSQQESRVEVRTSQVEPVLRELFLRDPQLSGLELTNSTLEDAFLRIIDNSSSETAQDMTA